MTSNGTVLAVAGNPNVGKTSLFNALTGLRYHVGNYPGVTVEMREGRVRGGEEGAPITLLDLPGTYSLTPQSEDEQVAYDVLSGRSAATVDAILLVLDATNLSRNLYLVTQVLSLGIPCVVALNMVDAAREAGVAVDADGLSKVLGLPVYETVARTGAGVPELVDAVRSLARGGAGEAPEAPSLDLNEDARQVVEEIGAQVGGAARASWLLGADVIARDGLVSSAEREILDAISLDRRRAAIGALVQARYSRVESWLADASVPTTAEGAFAADAAAFDAPAMRRTARIDRVLTHRVFGPLCFLLVMALVFQSIFSWSEPLMGVIEWVMGTAAVATRTTLGPGLFTDLLTEGLIAGVGNVLVFVPQIVVLFLSITVLEETGYMARAAFIVDRLMNKVGLSGKSFVPLLGGYACAIPAIMSTRSIPRFRDRLVTIMMVPFMSCSARLPVYALMIGALFEANRQLLGPFTLGGALLLGMYMLSTLAALGVGAVYRRTVLKGPTPALVLELPPYRLPRFKDTLAQVWDRTFDFIRDAGTIILTFTIILWGLFTFPRVDPSEITPEETPIEYSVAGRLGHAIEPGLRPIGQDWRTGIGLIGSFAAREVFVSTMGLAYGIEGADDDDAPLRDRIQRDRDQETGARRHTPRSGLALMVFFVFACQCISTLAVVRRETRSWRWPIVMFVSMTALAYLMALLTYQVGGLLGFE
jgi:ferrous iron transport protein B